MIVLFLLYSHSHTSFQSLALSCPGALYAAGMKHRAF